MFCDNCFLSFKLNFIPKNLRNQKDQFPTTQIDEIDEFIENNLKTI